MLTSRGFLSPDERLYTIVKWSVL